MSVLILDNGGNRIKAGMIDDQTCRLLPNATAKVQKSMQYLISDQLDNFHNGSLLQFIRPCDRGYINNWQCQIEIWNRLFQEHYKVNPADTSLLLTEPIFNLPSIQRDYNEIIFEYFGFKEYLRRPAPWFSAYGHEQAMLEAGKVPEANSRSCTVVDSGFSFSHIVPFLNGKCQRHAVKRVNIGGKLLTNYLKELVSYRQWNMMDEFVLINQVKEDLCYVSNDVIKELAPAKGQSRATKAALMQDPMGGKLKKFFVLPDFHNIIRGYVKQDDEPITQQDQLLVMETERFAVPELLFYPCDIGLQQAGLSEATAQAMQHLNIAQMGESIQQIVLTGGNVKFPNFKQRYEDTLRPLIPDIFDFEVVQPAQPDLYAWQSARKYLWDLRQQDNRNNYNSQYHGYSTHFMTKQSYLEQGHQRCNDFFDSAW